MTLNRSRTEPEPTQLQKTAERLAAGRRERVTSAHLLCAMAELGGNGWELLKDRKLTLSSLLKAARASTDDEPHPLDAAAQRAAEVASRMRAPEVTSVHLLIALLSSPRCAAYRALDQFGLDVGRLRVTAMNSGLSMLGRQRLQTRVTDRQVLTASRAVTVPLTPSPKPITARLRGGATAEQPAAEEAELADAGPGDARRSAASQSPKTPGATSGSVAAGAARKSSRAKAATTRASARFGLDRRRFKLLSSLGKNLTLQAARGELPEVVGRDQEVEAVLDVLAKCHGNNPCLVGPSGVGKTCTVYRLAKHIVDQAEAGTLDDHILIEVSVPDLLAGTGVRGALAQRLTEITHEVAASQGRVVLFLDDIHQLLVGAGSEEASAELKRALAQGELPCIAATSPQSFEAVIEEDAALHRRFTRVDIDEPDLDQACDILEALRPGFEQHHGLQLESAASVAAVAWSARYLAGRALPEKAIAVLDLAAARCRRRGTERVLSAHVAEVISEMADVPSDRLLESDGERLLHLEDSMAERVVGHEHHLQRFGQIVRRNAAGLGGQRPIGTFLLLGPTGVGKTETAKALAATLFGSPLAMTRLDLSEFSEAHAVARLIGAPPGYVGYESGGQLTESVRRRPYQVLLLDEIEKAHPEVLETFLPLFDEGRLTDGRGRTVDFTNTVIVLTSNIGAREATGSTERRVGFGNGSSTHADTASRVEAAARAALSPEFFNRIDEVMVFESLDERQVEEIARRLLQELADTVLEQRGVELRIEPGVVGLLLREGGFDATLGARPMRRAIARLVEAPLAEALLDGRLGDGQSATLSVTESGNEVRILPQVDNDTLVRGAAE